MVYVGYTLRVYRLRERKLLETLIVEQTHSARLHTVNDMYPFAPEGNKNLLPLQPLNLFHLRSKVVSIFLRMLCMRDYWYYINPYMPGV